MTDSINPVRYVTLEWLLNKTTDQLARLLSKQYTERSYRIRIAGTDKCIQIHRYLSQYRIQILTEGIDYNDSFLLCTPSIRELYDYLHAKL